MKTGSKLWLVATLLVGFVLSNTSCGQDRMQATVSKKINGENKVTLGEGVIGTVKTHDGKIVYGAMVVPTSLSSDSPPIPEIAITTNKNGQYEWALPPGPYQMTVVADGYREHKQNVEVKQNQVTTLDFILD